MVDIVQWAESPVGFYTDRRWEDGRWVLECEPIKLAGYHQDLLRHVFTPDGSGRLPYGVAAWCEPCKSGKSAICGLAGEFAALHLDGDVIMASAKRDQAASLMYRSLTDSVEWNPHLRIEPNRYEVAFRSGNTVRAIASNSRTEAGARFSLALFDELWAYTLLDLERLWSEFKLDPTRTHCLKMAVGYGGYLESTLWLNLLERGLAGEPVPELAHIEDGRGQPACWRNGRLFVFWSHECKQPWQTEAWIESQRQTLSAAQFQRMIEADFAAGVGDFCEQSAWESCIDPDHHPLEPGSSQPVYIGLDVAVKAGGDDCALAAVYPHDGQVKLAFHKIWRGGKERREDLKLSETVEPYIKQLAQQYRVVGVWFDPRFAMLLTENLRKSGIRCVEVFQTASTRGPKDSALLEMIYSNELVLYPDEEIRFAAASAVAKEIGGGLVYIKKTRGMIDFLVGLSLCADEARYGPTVLSASLLEEAVNLDAEDPLENGKLADWFFCEDPIQDYWLHCHLADGMASYAMCHILGERRVPIVEYYDDYEASFEDRPILYFSLLVQIPSNGADVRTFIRKLVEERGFGGLRGLVWRWDPYGVPVPESIRAGVSFSGDLGAEMLSLLEQADIHAQVMEPSPELFLTLADVAGDRRLELPSYPSNELLNCISIAVHRAITDRAGPSGGFL